jgi:drug/metabolite transporter (DMT)-like permease
LDPVVLSVGSLAGGALSLLPLALVAGVPARPSPAPLGSLLALALLGTAVAYLLYFHLVLNAGATSTALVTYLNPATAVFWGWIVLGEPITARTLVGLCLIVSGILLASSTAPKPAPAAERPCG